MIKLTKVTHHYQNQPTLQEVSLMISQGEFVYVLGKSGAGKSTFIKLLYNEEVASSGEVIVADVNLTAMEVADRARFRQRIGVVFQEFKLLQRYTVAENLAYPLQVVGCSPLAIQERVAESLAFVGLSGKQGHFPEELSGGEQQRVAIARALIGNPQVLVADEPTGNLDPKNSRLIVSLLERVSLGGTTVVMVTHDQTLVAQYPQRILKIAKGRLIADTPREANG